MLGAQSLDTEAPDTKGQSCLFLTYRREGTSTSGDSKSKQSKLDLSEQRHCLTFLSPRVSDKVLDWLVKRPLQEQQELFLKMGLGELGRGYKSAAGNLFQRLCIHKWIEDDKIILETREFQQRVGSKPSAQYKVNLKQPGQSLNLTWDDICGLTSYLTPQLPENWLIYEKHAYVGLPVVGALLIKGNKAYLFHHTVSETHNISQDSWKDLIARIPPACQEVFYIMINPRELEKVPFLKHAEVAKCLDKKKPTPKVHFLHGFPDKLT